MRKQLISVLLLMVIGLSTMTAQSQFPMGEMPDLQIQELKISSDTFREDEAIVTNMQLFNNDSMAFNNLRVSVRLGSSAGEPGSETQFDEVGYQNIDTIQIGETLNLTMSFMSDAGSYVLQVIVVFNNEDLMNTAVTDELQITSEPVGDNQTILIGIAAIFGIILLIVFTQWVNDRIRLRGNGKSKKIIS